MTSCIRLSSSLKKSNIVLKTNECDAHTMPPKQPKVRGRPFDSEGGGAGTFLEINILTLKMLEINNLSSSGKKINNLT